MKFREYLDVQKKKGTCSEESERVIFTTLHNEGFSDEQINDMDAEKARKLFMDSFVSDFLTIHDATMANAAKLVRERPDTAPQVSAILKRLRREFESVAEELEKQVEDKERKAGRDD